MRSLARLPVGRIGLLIAGVAATLILLNVAGVLRYPGGPLRDASADGLLWLDVRAAGQGSNTTGFGPGDQWAVGRSYDYALMSIHNPWPFTATVGNVTPLEPSPGLSVEAIHVQRPGSSVDAFALFPSGERLDQSELQRDFIPVPAEVAPTGDTHDHDLLVFLVLRSNEPGAFGFSALALDYRVGPLTFRTTYHQALAGCLGPLPPNETCPTSE